MAMTAICNSSTATQTKTMNLNATSLPCGHLHLHARAAAVHDRQGPLVAPDALGARALDLELQLQLLDVEERRVGVGQRLDLLGLRGDLGRLEPRLLGLLLLLVGDDARGRGLDAVVEEVGVADLDRLGDEEELAGELRLQGLEDALLDALLVGVDLVGAVLGEGVARLGLDQPVEDLVAALVALVLVEAVLADV